MARRPNTIPPSASTTTAVDTCGSCHRTKPSFGHASTSRPSITRGTNAAPQLTQKWPTRRKITGRLSVLLLFRRRRAHVRDADLVAAALLGGIERLVGPLHQGGEQGRLIGGCDADADGELQAAGENRGRHLGSDSLGKRSCSGLGGLVED